MSRRPTIEDVARDAGVSKGAVSFALNDRPGVAPATRERILQVAADLGWTPSHRGRALAADGRVDGVFLTDVRVGDPRPALLERLGLPAVVIAPSCADHADAACVCVDDRPGVTAAVEHLVALGHRRIAHVGGPVEFVHSRSRRDAWAGALRDAGLRPGPAVESDFSAAGGAAATARLLDLAEPPTAVVYANDLMAIAGAAFAAGRGLDVPTDLSVTGFDDTEVAAHLRPALTTIRTDAFGWGRAAADRLTRLVSGAETTQPTTMPPPRLVVRDSTAPPRPDRSRTSPGSELR